VTSSGSSVPAESKGSGDPETGSMFFRLFKQKYSNSAREAADTILQPQQCYENIREKCSWIFLFAYGLNH